MCKMSFTVSLIFKYLFKRDLILLQTLPSTGQTMRCGGRRRTCGLLEPDPPSISTECPADARLLFTPMHKNVNVQLPDLQVMDMRVNFSINVFSAVLQICKDLGNYFFCSFVKRIRSIATTFLGC